MLLTTLLNAKKEQQDSSMIESLEELSNTQPLTPENLVIPIQVKAIAV
jgi:hypothetical protein